MGNKIPRKFNKIIGKMLVETNLDKVNDMLHIYKNDCSTGYLSLNVRTGKYAYVFASMLRNENVFELREVK